MPAARIPETVEPGRRLGRNLNHDPRSKLFRFKAEPQTALVDVEHTIHIPILDQGELGSCVANTGTEILAADPFWPTLPPQTALNEDYAVQLYRDVTRADPFPGAWEPDDTGSDGLSLAKVLKARGLVAGYQHILDPVSALAALQTVPLAVGIQWLTGCDHPNNDGVVSYTGAVRGGHEITAYRYDAAKQLVWFRNHWGAAWAINGCFAMTVTDFARALAADGDATVMVPTTQPAPQPTPGFDLTPLNVWADKPHVWKLATAAAKTWKTYRNQL